MKTGLRNAESQSADVGRDAAPSSGASPNPRTGPGAGGMGGLAETLRNMGGAGAGAGAGAGGMPDLASLMNNPAMMQMAQQMMANGGLERLMSNPAVANMVSYIDRVTPFCSCVTYTPCAFPDGPGEQRGQLTIYGRNHGKSRITRSVSSPMDNRFICSLYP